jgi:hypothetical protein
MVGNLTATVAFLVRSRTGDLYASARMIAGFYARLHQLREIRRVQAGR